MDLGDVEEPAVGGVEHGDAERQVGAHDPVFAVARGQGADHVAELDGEEVQVKQHHGGQGHADATDAKNRRVAAVDEISHAAEEHKRPHTRPRYPPDADAVQVGLLLGIGRDSELGPHDAGELQVQMYTGKARNNVKKKQKSTREL